MEEKGREARGLLEVGKVVSVSLYEGIIREQEMKMEEERREKIEMENYLFYAKQQGLKTTEAIKKLNELADAVGVTVRKAAEVFREVTKVISNDFLEYVSMDEWQRQKKKMTNNERRRKGFPMVRRQQYLRIKKNQRRKRKKPKIQ